MPDTLYDRDALAWAEQQADLLRRVAAGERVNAAVDWPHVIEEVEELGLSELRACQSLLQQALTHLLKLGAWPDDRAASHWRDEAGAFLDDAARRFTPSMRQRIALDQLYAAARRRAGMARQEFGPARLAFPALCPFELDQLLAGDLPSLGAHLTAASAPTLP